MKKRVVFLSLENINMPSSRIRCYQNAAELNKLGWCCEVNGKHPETANFVIFQKRFEGPDQALARRCRGIVIFDQSDPYWLKDYARTPVEAMARIARIVTLSTTAQVPWFKKRGIKTAVIPNGFDFSIAPKVEKENKFTICWTGNVNSERFLPMLIPALKKLSQVINFNLKIIGAKLPDKFPTSFGAKCRCHFVPWTLSTEAAEIAKCQIGLAPMILNSWGLQKSAYKPLIYMALGLPAVCSPIPSYLEIISHGQNGFIAHKNNPESWYEALKALTNDEFRLACGQNARKTAESFSKEKIAAQWDKLFHSLCRPEPKLKHVHKHAHKHK